MQIPTPKERLCWFLLVQKRKKLISGHQTKTGEEWWRALLVFVVVEVKFDIFRKWLLKT